MIINFLIYADNFISSITAYYHCQPGSHNYDKIGKGRHVLNLIGERFLAVYNPHYEYTMGAMIPYKRQSSLKQFMPNKPVKHDMKVWMHAASHK